MRIRILLVREMRSTCRALEEEEDLWEQFRAHQHEGTEIKLCLSALETEKHLEKKTWALIKN